MINEQDSEKLPELLLAAKSADVGRFKQLLNDGADVLQKDRNYRTVLHWAANSGSVPIMTAGVSKGLAWHINAKSKRGLTPLHEACLAGHRKCIYLLLSLGADVTIQTMEGYTALMCAAGNGNVDATRIIIGAGCDGNEVIKPIGVSALHIASWTGHEDVIEALLKLGCDPDAKSQVGKTSMEYAIEQRHTGCMEVLRNHTKKKSEDKESAEKMFKTKIQRMKKKVTQYYEDKLQEEIAFFEQQLQSQHCKDLGVIMKLTTELERVYGLLNTEATTSKLSIEHKPLIDVSKMPRSVAQRSVSRASMKTRTSSMDMPISSRNSGYYSSDDDDDDDDNEISLELSPTSRPATPMVHHQRKDASMSELVEAAAQRRDSMNNLRRQNSTDSNQNFKNLSPREVVAKRRLPISRVASPALSEGMRRRHTSTPTTPNLLPLPHSPVTPHPPTAQPQNSPQSRTRRKSSGFFTRRHSLLDESVDEEEKTRRKSVAVRMPTSPRPNKTEHQKNKTNMLFSVPIPDIALINSGRNEMSGIRPMSMNSKKKLTEL